MKKGSLVNSGNSSATDTTYTSNRINALIPSLLTSFSSSPASGAVYTASASNTEVRSARIYQNDTTNGHSCNIAHGYIDLISNVNNGYIKCQALSLATFQLQSQNNAAGTYVIGVIDTKCKNASNGIDHLSQLRTVKYSADYSTFEIRSKQGNATPSTIRY